MDLFRWYAHNEKHFFYTNDYDANTSIKKKTGLVAGNVNFMRYDDKDIDLASGILLPN